MNGVWRHNTGNQWLYVCEEVVNNMRVREIPVKISRYNWRWKVTIMGRGGGAKETFLLPKEEIGHEVPRRMEHDHVNLQQVGMGLLPEGHRQPVPLHLAEASYSSDWKKPHSHAHTDLDIQDCESGLPRIFLPRTPLNRGVRKG